MAGNSSAALSRDLQSLFEDGSAGGLSDRPLLDRFAGGPGPAAEAAFEALVRRHGPMVLRVCRGAGLDPDAAQDAFQATFLVLVRRSGSLRGLESLGGWLYGVACRVAARARVEAARRRAVEGRAALRVVQVVEPSAPDRLDREELGPIVQEEVRRLPEKYRAVVVLCYWEGLTQEQAAARLGCPLGTVRSRLARARDLLRRRLARRGAAPLADLTGAGFDVSAIAPGPVAVPDPWVVATVKAGTIAAAGGSSALAGAASASVALLVQDSLRRMLMLKLKTIAIGLSFLAMGTAGAIVAAPQARDDRRATAPEQGSRAVPTKQRAPATTGASTGKVQPPLRALGEYVIEPPDMIKVEVLEALPGRPITGQRLVRPDGRISLGYYGEIYIAGSTVMDAKAKIVEHLRQYLSDELLGLLETDPQTGDPRRDEKGRLIRKPARDTDRVFVEVTSYNSKAYYVQGAVNSPGRFPVTGHDTVLDALSYAGGLLPGADRYHAVLYRPGPPGAPGMQQLPVNVEQITVGGDPTTNYQLLPGDRLVIPTRSAAGPAGDEGRAARPAGTPATPDPDEEPRRPARRAPAIDDEPDEERPARRREGIDEPASLRGLERRLIAVERKLDRILEALERREPAADDDARSRRLGR